MAKSKEDTSTVRDSEIKDDRREGPKPSPSGKALHAALEKEAAARRSGKGR